MLVLGQVISDSGFGEESVTRSALVLLFMIAGFNFLAYIILLLKKKTYQPIRRE